MCIESNNLRSLNALEPYDNWFSYHFCSVFHLLYFSVTLHLEISCHLCGVLLNAEEIGIWLYSTDQRCSVTIHNVFMTENIILQKEFLFCCLSIHYTYSLECFIVVIRKG